jgi:hypothetical protein
LKKPDKKKDATQAKKIVNVAEEEVEEFYK